MRLYRRTLCEILVWPRVPVTGALGGVAEGFSSAPVAIEGSVGYVENALSSDRNALSAAPYGVQVRQSLKLRLRNGAPIRTGDGVSLPGEGAPAWRCVEVDVYPFVTVARLERMAQ